MKVFRDECFLGGVLRMRVLEMKILGMRVFRMTARVIPTIDGCRIMDVRRGRFLMIKPGKGIRLCRGGRFAVANRTRATQASPPIGPRHPRPYGWTGFSSGLARNLPLRGVAIST